MDRPNILLITSDQQRADTVGAHGSRQARTPNLDRLAQEGVVFDRAYVQNTVCIPSRACIQTGRYTHQHGVRHMETVIDNSPGLGAHEITIMERLQAAGYRTGAAGKIHMMPERGFHWMELVGGKGARWTQPTGLEIGPAPLGKQYAAWLEARSPGAYERIYAQRRQPEYRKYLCSIVNCLPLELYVETYILEKSTEFLREKRDRPFFLWCGFCGPHGPHDPPPSHAHLYPFEEIELPATFRAELGDRPSHLQRRREPAFASPEGEDVLRRYISYYYCLVTLIDEYVGRLLEVLAEKRLLESTLIIYTSDHGEMLGDFGMTGKGTFYEGVVRVPLIVRPPGGCVPRRFTGIVEAMDIAATILDYAGILRPREMSARTLRPILSGGDGGRRCALSEFTNNEQTLHGKCLITDRYKYILWSCDRGGEFYDLRNDPLELHNRYYDPAFRDERDHHAELLLKKLMESEHGYTGHREEPY